MFSAYVKLTKWGPIVNSSLFWIYTPSFGMFIHVPFSLLKSNTLKLLNPSYFNCACFADKPTPSICNVSPYNLASPDPNTYPSGCVVMNKNLFLYRPSIHFRTYFNDNYFISVMLDFICDMSKLSFVIASILYFCCFYCFDFYAFLLGWRLTSFAWDESVFWPDFDVFLPPVFICLYYDQENDSSFWIKLYNILNLKRRVKIM